MRWFLVVLAVIVALLGVAYVTLSAPDIPRATMEAKYATPPSRFVVLPDGARVHYRIRGAANAPTLVLLHGSNASLFTWEPWSNMLSDKFRVVSLDLPGHGLTGAVPNHDYSGKGMATFVTEFAYKIGLKKFALAGNSMGGGVAARFAETYPDRVTALILVDAAGMPSKMGDRIPLAFQLLRMPWLQGVMAHANPKPLVREGLEQGDRTKGDPDRSDGRSLFGHGAARGFPRRDVRALQSGGRRLQFREGSCRRVENAGADPLGRGGSPDSRRRGTQLAPGRSGLQAHHLSGDRSHPDGRGGCPIGFRRPCIPLGFLMTKKEMQNCPLSYKT